MTDSATKATTSANSRFSRVLLRLGIAVVSTGIVLTILYALIPWLVASLIPYFGQQWGLDSIELRIAHPGLHSVEIEQLTVVSDSVHINGQNGVLRYAWKDFSGESVGDLEFDRLHLSVLESSQVEQGSNPPNVENVFDVLPFRSVAVRELSVAIPSIEFAGVGQLQWGPSILSFTLNGVSPEAASQTRVVAELTLDGSFNAELSAPGIGAEDSRVSVQGNIESNQMTTAGQIQLEGYSLTLVAAFVGAPSGSGRIIANFEMQLPWPIPDNLSLRDAVVSVPTANIDWRSDAGDLALLDVSASANLAVEQLEASFRGTIRGTINDSAITATASEDYAVRYQSGTLSGGSGLQLRIKKPDSEVTANLHDFTIIEDAGTHVNFTADIDSAVDSVRAKGKFATGFTISGNDPITAAGDMTFTGNVDIDSLHYVVQWNSAVTMDDNQLTTTGTVTTSIFNAAQVSAGYNIDTGAGSVRASNSVRFRAPLGKSLLPDWAEIYDLDRGQIAATVALNWKSTDAIAAELALTLTDSSGHYDENRATGINGQFLLTSPNSLDPGLWILAPTEIQINGVDVGLPITDARIALSWSKNQTRVTSATASLLGGTAIASPFTYDADTGSALIDIALQNLELAEVLALEGDDIGGNGLLSGHLPVVIRDDTPTIVNGTLQAHPPGGVIQLKPSFSGLTGQAGLDFALLALKDFAYTDLTTTVSYNEQGDLALGVQLKGRNPTVEGGRPINYNLNINENVPVLLESLRLNERVTSGIERKIGQR